MSDRSRWCGYLYRFDNDLDRMPCGCTVLDACETWEGNSGHGLMDGGGVATMDNHCHGCGALWSTYMSADPLGDGLSVVVVNAILELDEQAIEDLATTLGLGPEIRRRLIVAHRGLVARRELAAIEAASPRRRAPVMTVRQVTNQRQENH